MTNLNSRKNKTSKIKTKKKAKKVTKKGGSKVSKPIRRKKASTKKLVKKNKSFVGRFLSVFWRLALVLLVALIAYVFYLDLVITKRFEGQRWALPAHVYSRPLDVYVGGDIAISDIVSELLALGYQESKTAAQITKPGQFYQTQISLTIFLRGFEFWDGEQESQKVEILWDSNRIDDIRYGKKAVTDVRLEPRLFGSVSPLSHEDRSLITLDKTPQTLIDALLVMEDRKFYSHWGIDPLGIARAFIVNLKAGRAVQGGSTLTQQLIKNYFLTSERKLKRKFIEVIMAFLLEFRYEKDEILQAYLNEVHLGQSDNRAIHGFGLGSQFIFGRPLQELDINELATLAGMVKAPSSYNPLRNPERAKKRRDLVLDVMAGQGLIDKATAEAEKAISLNAVAGKARKSLRSHPSFTDLVRQQLKDDYASEDLSEAGLKIFTTLDPVMQSTLNQSIEQELAKITVARNLPEDSLQVAAVTVRTDNGEVVALSGARDPLQSGFNRALKAKRPIGSLLKPFIALSAIQSKPLNYQLNTSLRDEPLIVSQNGAKDWSPQNYDKTFWGETLLIDALSQSRNIPIVSLGLDVGMKNIASDVHRFGLQPKPRALPSLILGSVEASVVDVAQLYLTLASGGFRTPLRSVRSVQTVNGEALDRYALDIEQVAEPQYVNLVAFALQEVLRSGTARGFNNKVPESLGLAVKTGTTDGYRDSWFAGYSGDFLTVIWVGRDDNQSTGLTGASGAGRLWFEYMSKLSLQPLELDLTTDMQLLSTPSYSKEDKYYSCDKPRNIPVLLEAAESVGSILCDQLENNYEIVDDSPTPLWREKRSALDKWLDRIFQ